MEKGSELVNVFVAVGAEGGGIALARVSAVKSDIVRAGEIGVEHRKWKTYIGGVTRILLCLAVMALAVSPCLAQDGEIATLIEKVKATPAGDGGISPEEAAMAERFEKVGPRALPYLLPLLTDQSPGVRNVAAYIVRGMPGLTDEHLDVLITAQRNDDSWLPFAIAKIGTPRAIRFLVEELVRVRETGNQLIFSMEVLGPKAVPDLIEVYRGKTKWDDKLERTMTAVFESMGQDAETAVDPLLAMANDEKLPTVRRVRAIAAVAAIGRPTEKIVPALEKLIQSPNDEICIASEKAIMRTESIAAAGLMLKNLQKEKDEHQRLLLIRDIAELRSKAVAAGPVMMGYLSSNDWELRIAAARALGYIGYKPAEDELIKLLSEKEDWRLVLSAAQSLGQLRAKKGLSELAKVARDYWFPPVRETAARAAQCIRDKKAFHPPNDEGIFGIAFFTYTKPSEDNEDLTLKEAKEAGFSLTDFSAVPKEKGAKRRQLSYTEIRVEGGTLVGTDQGEFGGDLALVGTLGLRKVLAKDNTESVYLSGETVYAITGLAHLMMNDGAIYRVRYADKRWVAERWRELPGAPIFSQLLKDDRLFVSCNGGIVLVSPNGDMQFLSKAEALAWIKAGGSQS